MDPVTQLKQEILALYGEYQKLKPSGMTKLKLAGTGETRLIASEKGTTISYVVQDSDIHFSSCFILDGDFPDNIYFNGKLHADEAVVTHSYNSPVVIMSSRGFRRAVGDSYTYTGRGVSRIKQKETGREFEIWDSIVEKSLNQGWISPPDEIVDKESFVRFIDDYRNGVIEAEKRNAFDALSSLIKFYLHGKADLAVLKPFSPENRRFDLVTPAEVVITSERIMIETNKAITSSGKVSLVSKNPPPIHLPSTVTSSYGQIPMEKSDLRRTDGITRATRTQAKLSPFRAYIESILLFGPVQKYVKHVVSATTQMGDGNMKIYVEGSEVVSPR